MMMAIIVYSSCLDSVCYISVSLVKYIESTELR